MPILYFFYSNALRRNRGFVIMIDVTHAKKKLIHFASLGCSKNLVDSEVMLGILEQAGLQHTSNPEEAEVIVVNTCSFIDVAKKESVDVILEMSDYKNAEKGKCKALVVAGCLAQRYSGQVEEEIPEVDLLIGTGEYNKIATLLDDLEKKKLKQKTFVGEPKFIHTELDPRINSAPSYMAWLKVSEGCDRLCTFCVIPQIRGKLRSRTVDSLYAEAMKLVKSGVVELNLISQDLSQYGKDLLPPNTLFNLLERLESIAGLRWIRLFYFYPDDLNEAVIKKIADSEKICKYLDIPIQHFSNRILKLMNRKITGEEILRKVNLLRAKIPEIVLRTSLIVGFPGESEDDFAQMEAGVKEIGFNHLGVFAYSDEEEAPSSKLPNKINGKLIAKRQKKIYDVQKKIAAKLNKKFIGQTIDVLIEGNHEETDLLWRGRHSGQAPDIDGKVIINDKSEGLEVKVGDMVKVLVEEVVDYDLVGKIISQISKREHP